MTGHRVLDANKVVKPVKIHSIKDKNIWDIKSFKRRHNVKIKYMGAITQKQMLVPTLKDWFKYQKKSSNKNKKAFNNR